MSVTTRLASTGDRGIGSVRQGFAFFQIAERVAILISLPPFGIEEPAISCRSAAVGGNETSVDLNHTGFTPGAPATPNETAPPAALPPVQLVAVDGS